MSKFEKSPYKATLATAVTLWFGALSLAACGGEHDDPNVLAVGVNCPPATEPLIGQPYQAKADDMLRFWVSCKGEGRFVSPDDADWIEPFSDMPFNLPTNAYEKFISVDYVPDSDEQTGAATTSESHRQLDQVVLHGVEAVNSIKVVERAPNLSDLQQDR